MPLRKTPPTFQDYAEVYDALYGDKDYEQECRIIDEILRIYGGDTVQRILDIGCGTGGHAIPLARNGYDLCGIDRSVEMLAIARDKAEEAGLSNKISFRKENANLFELETQFDVSICMFAVLSYQTSNDALFSTLRSARKHLRTGGLFIGDLWYGPAVLSQRPSERTKKIKNGDERIIRIVKPELDTQNSIVHVNYEILQIDAHRVVKMVKEVHSMRYLFKTEIEFFLNHAGFRLEHFCPAFELENDVDESTWSAMFIACAI